MYLLFIHGTMHKKTTDLHVLVNFDSAFFFLLFIANYFT